MKGFCFRNPLFQGVGWVLHGEDHGGDLSIKSHGKLSHHSKFVFKLGLGSEVFELIDEVLESIIWSPVFVLSGFLDEFRQVSSGPYFGIKGLKFSL